MRNGLPPNGDKRTWYLGSVISLGNPGPELFDLRMRAAARAAGYIMEVRNIHNLICPATHSIPIEQEWPAANRLPWYKIDEDVFMQHSDGMIVTSMPGWAKSKGIMQEVDWFQSRGLPVYLFGAKRLFTSKEWRTLGG